MELNAMLPEFNFQSLLPNLKNGLSELVPQVFTNIYSNYQRLNQEHLHRDDKVEAIQNIVKDCFRVLLTIPLVMLIREGYTYADSPMSGVVALGIFAISPASNMLIGATFLSCYSISKLVNVVAKKSFADIGAAVFAIMAAKLLSEQYNRYEHSLISIPEKVLMSIPEEICEYVTPEEEIPQTWTSWIKAKVSGNDGHV